MIVSPTELLRYSGVSSPDLFGVPVAMVAEKLVAFESLIRAKTNNNFQRRNRRCTANISEGAVLFSAQIFRDCDTVEISGSEYNNGLYVVYNNALYVNRAYGDFIWPPSQSALADLIDETGVTVTKVVYPPEIKTGVMDCLRWQIRNEQRSSGDKSKMPLASETISRHSYTFASDPTENDIDPAFGVPKKLTSFLRPYMKARF